MAVRLLFLGTGSSMGVPVVGCHCRVCHSTDARDRRSRAAVLVTYRDKILLLDAGPDVRVQLLAYGVMHLDGLILTHAHYDHVAGLDDLRPLLYKRGSPLPMLLSTATWEAVRSHFAYLFQVPGSGERFAVAELPAERGEISFEGLQFRYFTYEQMGTQVNGFRFGNLAYVSDIRKYPETLRDDLAGVETLVVSALRFAPSPMHFSVDEALAFADSCGAEKVWLSHIAHDLEHGVVEQTLPAHVRMAYDGLELSSL